MYSRPFPSGERAAVHRLNTASHDLLLVLGTNKSDYTDNRRSFNKLKPDVTVAKSQTVALFLSISVVVGVLGEDCRLFSESCRLSFLPLGRAQIKIVFVLSGIISRVMSFDRRRFEKPPGIINVLSF